MTPTTPDGVPESTELPTTGTSHNIENLLKTSLERTLWKPASPETFDIYRMNHDGLHDQIRTNMRLLWHEDAAWWASITNDMIASATRGDHLKDQIARYYSGLVLQRKRTFDRALEIFPTIVDQRADWSTILSIGFADLDEDALRNLIHRTANIRKLIYKIFPRLKDETSSEKRNFDRIFHDRDSYFTDDERKNRLRDIHHNYDKYNQVPDGSDIAFILESYQWAPNRRKKELLIGFWVSLSIEKAYREFGLIDDVFLETLAEREMGSIYRDLSADDKKDFIASLALSDTVAISARDLDESKIGNILGNEQKRRKLGQEIFRVIAIDTPEDTRSTGMWQAIKKRKAAERSDAWGHDDGGWEWTDVVEQIRLEIGVNTIKNIHVLKEPNAVIEFDDEKGNPQYIRIKEVDTEVHSGGTHGLKLEWLPVVDGILREGQPFEWTYDDFMANLKNLKNGKILRSTEFDALLVGSIDGAINGKIYDGRPAIEADPVTSSNIVAKLDILDEAGRSYGFEVGTAFVAPSQDEWKEGENHNADIWQVNKISGNKVDLMASNGFILKNQDVAMIYEVLRSSGNFERIGKFTSDADILTGLKWFSLDCDAELKDGQLIVKEKDDHEHVHEKKITCFTSTKGGHIRMESIKDGIVKFWEFDDGGNEMSKIKEYAKKKWLDDKKIKGLYTWKAMSYPAFLKYLETENLQASTKDVIVPDAHHDLDHDEHAHMTSSLFGRIMKWQNPASIWKGLEMIWHGIEHTLEKWAKLDAARFAMGTAKFLGLEDTAVWAQIYSDITDGSKKIIEAIETKLFGIPGPAGRLKAIHIAHNRDSRPEEVVAAMNYMLKSYGHFYAEDVKHYQPIVNQNNISTADPGYFAFLDGFIITSKIGDLQFWRQKAYAKAITEMGTEEDHENEPSEEQLMHALMKILDGKWSEFPYAAWVVKAIGWPGGFENTWKFEGFDKAHEKWVKQTQMVNAQWRLNKGVGYFNTHEIYKAAGAMEAVAGKIKSPEYQAMPFIWACGGYSRYASHTALQKIKWYGENGMSFHAFGFLRNEKDNTIYRKAVAVALKDLERNGKIRGRASAEFASLCKRMEKVEKKKVTDSNYGWVTPADRMALFWKKYQWQWLHDALQGKNGWMIKKVKDGDSDVKAYQQTLCGPKGAHSNMLNNNSIPGTPYGKDWFEEHGYQNIILAPGEDGLNSMKSMLNKIQFWGYSGGGKPMNDEHDKKIWKYVVKHINEWLRDTSSFDGDEALQKAQYLAYRKEMIDYFTQQLGSRSKPESMENSLGTYPYFKEFESMGIDPSSLFYESKVDLNAESDYQSWKSGGRSITRSTQVPNIQSMVTVKADDAINRKRSQSPPRWPLPYKWGKQKTNTSWGDSDAMYPTGSHGDTGDSDGGDSGWE